MNQTKKKIRTLGLKETPFISSLHVRRSPTSDVNRACQGHISLSYSTEEGAVVNQPGDAVVHHNFPQVLVVQDV